jgi:hypothetical protein
MHRKENRADSLNTPCTPDDGKLGRNMSRNKAERRNIETYRILVELHKDIRIRALFKFTDSTTGF